MVRHPAYKGGFTLTQGVCFQCFWLIGSLLYLLSDTYSVFCPAAEKKGPKGPLVTKNGGHVEYMWNIKKKKRKAISITHF